MSWLSWLIPGRSSATKGREAAPPVAAPVRIDPVQTLPPVAPPKLEGQSVLAWLLGCEALTDTPITPIERSALDAIAQTLAEPHTADDLLPRAAALIPQLPQAAPLPKPGKTATASKPASRSAKVA